MREQISGGKAARSKILAPRGMGDNRAGLGVCPVPNWGFCPLCVSWDHPCLGISELFE